MNPSLPEKAAPQTFAAQEQNRPSSLFRGRWRKIGLIAGASAVALVLVIVLLAPPVVGVVARSKIQSILAEKLQSDVTVEDVTFRWSGRVSVEGLRIVPKGFSDPLLDVKRIDAVVDLAAAVGGKVLADVEVVEPRILVEKNEAGTFNYEFPPEPDRARKPKVDEAPGEAPVVRVSVKVRDGRVALRAQGRQTEYSNLTAEAKIDTLEKPAEVALSLAGADGDKLQARGAIDVRRVTGPVTFVLENVSLKNLTGAARAYSTVLELDGRANGVLEYRLDGKLRFGGKAHVGLTDLHAAIARGRVLKLDRLAFTHEGTLDRQGGGLQTFTIVAGPALAGTVTASLRDAFGAREVHTELKLDSDLAALGKVLGPMGLLPKGGELSGAASLRGTVDSRGPTDADLKAGNVLPEASTWTLNVIASNPGLTLDGKPMKLDRVDLVDAGTLDARGNVRSSIKLSSGKAVQAGVTVEGKDVLGDSRSIRAELAADSDLAELGKVVEKLAGFKPGMALEGKAKLSGTVESLASGLVKANLDLKAADLVAVDTARKKRYDLDRAISAKLAGSWDGKTRTAIADAVTLNSSFATLDARGGVALAGKEPEIKPSSLKLDADLARLGTKLESFMEKPPGLSGRLEANGTFTGDRYTLAAEAKALKVVTAARTIGPIEARLDQRGTFKGGDLKLEVSDLTSGAATVKLSGHVDEVLEENRRGKLALETTVKPDELSKWVPDLGLGGPEIKLTTSVELKAGSLHLAGQTKLDGLTVAGKDEKGQPVTRTAKTGPLQFAVDLKGKDLAATVKTSSFEWVEKSYAAKGALEAQVSYDGKGTTGTTKVVNLEVVDGKKNTVKEPAVTVVHDIGFGSYDVRKIEVTSGFLRGTVKGKVLDRGGKTVLDGLEGRFTYHPDRLGAVLGPWLPGTFEGAEEKAVSVTLNGEATSGELVGILRGGRGVMDLDLAKFTTQGISVSGRTKITLDGGRMTSAAPLDVNRGKADLSGSIDFRDARERPESALDFKARGVEANADMGPLLESINPIFHTYNGKMEGKITSDFRLVWRGPVDPASAQMKKEAAQYMQGSGFLTVKDLVVTGSPAVGEIMKALGEGNSIQGELVATDLRVAGGRCEYKNMTLRLKAYELRFTGWVDFYDEGGKDKKYMHLMVEMPMTEGVVRRYPNLQKYLGKTFFVPLEGTVDRPRLDFDGAIAELAKRALEGVVQDKLEDALRRLLERRKK